MRAVFLRFPEVQELTGLSKATIYRQMEKGNFPKSIKLSERAVAWVRDDIDEWLRKRGSPDLDAGAAAKMARQRAERAAAEAEEATDQAALEAHRRGYSVEEAAEFMGCDPIDTALRFGKLGLGPLSGNRPDAKRSTLAAGGG